MKAQGWVAAAVAALSLGGCATVDQGAANAPARGAVAAGGGAAAGGFRIVNAVDLRNANGANLFYLLRDGERWSVSFDAEAFRRGNGERLAFWPEEKKVAFVFDRVDASRSAPDDAPMCGDADRDRAKRGYTSCSSVFSHKHTSGATVFARTLVGVATAGTSELSFANKGAQFQRLSLEEVQAALAASGVERQFWLRDYRQRAAATNVRGLNDFVRRYEHDDPERLLPKAREALATLARNASILDAAERATPKLADYRQRYMPANPQKYCRDLKGNAGDFQYCQAAAANIVGALADQRAAEARRADVCQAVAKAVPGGAQAGVCQPYSAGSCRASSAPGQQVCDILTRKGQS